MLVAVLAPFIVLAMGVAAHPRIPNAIRSTRSVPISKRTNGSDVVNTVGKDLKHIVNKVKKVLKHTKKPPTPKRDAEENPAPELNLTNVVTGYVAKVGVGNPATYYNLIVDTGSAITWVGANAPYQITNTSVNASESVLEMGGTFMFGGDLYNDTVTIAPGIAVSQQPIGVSVIKAGVYPYDGMLGLGPNCLSNGTLYPQNTSVIPTVTDNLFAQGTIEQNLVALSFEPNTMSKSIINGELTFGATDPAKYTGDISYFPITQTAPSSNYWGVDASFQYGGANGTAPVDILDTNAGIIDSGTALIYLSPDAYQRYVNATGAALNQTMEPGSGGWLYITPAQYENLQPLSFNVGNSTFELTPNAQIWPRELNSAIHGSDDLLYLVIHNIGDMFPGVDFVCGMAFLERFYSVFDTGNSRIGLAPTQFTNSTLN